MPPKAHTGLSHLVVRITGLPTASLKGLTTTVETKTRGVASIKCTPDKDNSKHLSLAVKYLTEEDATFGAQTIMAFIPVDEEHKATRIHARQNASNIMFSLCVQFADESTVQDSLQDIWARHGAMRVLPTTEGQGAKKSYYVDFKACEHALEALKECDKESPFKAGVNAKVKAGRNTCFVQDVVFEAKKLKKADFTIEELKEISSRRKQFGTKKDDVEKVVKSAASIFLPSATVRDVYVVKSSSEGKKKCKQTPPKVPDTFTSGRLFLLDWVCDEVEEEKIDKEAKEVRRERTLQVWHGMADVLEDAVALFKETWFKAKGKAWTEKKVRGIAQSHAELMKELTPDCRDPSLDKPISCWDICSVAQAFNADTIKQQLISDFGDIPVGGGDVDLAPFSALIAENIVSEKKMQQYCVSHFLQDYEHPHIAMQALRFTRNSICHIGGDSGLSAAAFECLNLIVSKAAGAIGCALKTGDSRARNGE